MLAVLLTDSLKTISRKLKCLDSVKAGLNGFQSRNGDAKTSNATKRTKGRDQ